MLDSKVIHVYVNWMRKDGEVEMRECGASNSVIEESWRAAYPTISFEQSSKYSCNKHNLISAKQK